MKRLAFWLMQASWLMVTGQTPATAGGAGQSPFAISPYFEVMEGGKGYLSRHRGMDLTIDPGPVGITLHGTTGTSHVELSFAGARIPVAKAEGLLPSFSNYYIGEDRGRWRTRVPHYKRVILAGLYAGVDAVFYWSDGSLEFDLIVAPGVDLDKVRMRFRGVRESKIERGDLLLSTECGVLRLGAPRTFEEQEGGRRLVESRYVARPNGEFGFDVRRTTSLAKLIIDPVLTFSTYFGGSEVEGADGVARVGADSQGNVYFTGTTRSPSIPSVPSKTTHGGGYEAYLVKTTASGELVFSVFYGGSEGEEVHDMVVDDLGRVVIGGGTSSPNLPQVKSLHPRRAAFDGFVARFDSAGLLTYSTYIGGDDFDAVHGVGLDSRGRILVTGATGSFNFPTRNALQRSKPTTGRCRFVLLGIFETTVSCRSAFVSKLDPDSGEAVFSTYLGGPSMDPRTLEGDRGYQIVADRQDNIVVVGETFTQDFPVTADAVKRQYSGSMDGFVSKLNADGQTLIRSTFIGGNGVDFNRAVSVDQTGAVYVSGSTSSTDLPVTRGSRNVRDADCYAAKLNDSFSAYTYLVTFGGTAAEYCLTHSLLPSGALIIAGGTESTDLALTSPLQPARGADDEGVLVVFDPTGNVVQSSYIGWALNDFVTDIFADSIGNVYITGQTNSPDFPTVRPLQRQLGGSYDQFVQKYTDYFVGIVGGPPAVLIVVSGNNQTGLAGARLAAPIVVEARDSQDRPVAGVLITFTATNAALDSPSVRTDLSGRASVNVTLGQAPGPATVVASAAGLPPVTFRATATGRISIVAAGSLRPGPLSPDSIGTAFGQDLVADIVRASSTTQLPKSLSGVTLRIRDVDGQELIAGLFEVTPGFVKFHVPFEVHGGTAAFTLTTANGRSFSGTAMIENLAPVLFSADGTGGGLASATVVKIGADGTETVEPVSRFQQETQVHVPVPITFGNAEQRLILRLDASGIRFHSGLANVSARVGGVDCVILSAGAEGNVDGLDQIQIVLPPSLSGRGEVPVEVVVDGVATNRVIVVFGQS